MIQRWGISFINEEEFKSDTGRYVLYTDHLAALAEKDAEIEQWKRIIVTHVDVIAEKEREVHDLKMEMNRMVRY